MQIEGLYLEVVRELEKRADIEIASKKKHLWHKKKGYKSYGIGKLDNEELIEKYLNIFEQLRLEERFRLTKMFYKSGFSEQANFGNTLLELCFERITPVQFDLLDEISGYFNNWATTD